MLQDELVWSLSWLRKFSLKVCVFYLTKEFGNSGFSLRSLFKTLCFSTKGIRVEHTLMNTCEETRPAKRIDLLYFKETQREKCSRSI